MAFYSYDEIKRFMIGLSYSDAKQELSRKRYFCNYLYGHKSALGEREKIFDRFYRIDKSRNRNEKRYGLGLSIAASTVLKNNGTIHVDYKDGYTIFTVILPI